MAACNANALIPVWAAQTSIYAAVLECRWPGVTKEAGGVVGWGQVQTVTMCVWRRLVQRGSRLQGGRHNALLAAALLAAALLNVSLHDAANLLGKA